MTSMPTQTGPELTVLQVTDRWRAAYGGAHVGIAVMRDVINPAHSEALEARKLQILGELRERFAGQDRAALLKDPALQAYDAYYRHFRKTYHVLPQLESILFRGKPFPTAAALVEAMLMAELQNLLLTAGHDLDALQLPLALDVALGTEDYIILRGANQATKAGDMMISDANDIISTIVYGPDQRTRITAETHNVLFTVYAPAGISEDVIRRHLSDLHENVILVAPEARAEVLQVYGTN